MHDKLPRQLIEPVSHLLCFVRYLIQRMSHDRVNVNAGYLTYITLLSIVPMLTVLLSVLSSFSIFANVGEVLQNFIIQHFVPAAGDAVYTALTEFVANTGRMTAIGSGFLFVAALMLISNIDNNLNYIWRVKVKRRPVFSFSMYWMILTLGPILVGASIVGTSYLTSLKILEHELLSGAFSFFLGWLPAFLALLAFTGLYVLVPNKKVYLSHAIIGAAVATLLFEVSKKGFAYYITQFPSYQLIYGALAAIPILFLWIYLCWFIVLIGAEFTAALGEKEHWRLNSPVIQSTAEKKQLTQKEQPSDSTDTESE
ncbi:virulence factor BrkB family protein [Vibrio variabilis]|uniref:virulence factor BrkB family protein n=1 Tax=Vibrio variabilis TaxID=990271 RepID=UPI000DDBAD2B|nr:virulence factor BrkB family protein [Vibrio variabilis]